MGDHCCIDGPTGTLAVWTGGTDLGPVLDPESYPTRVRFNSRLDNLGFLPTPRTGSVSIANWGEPNDPPGIKRTMFAHGRGYRPLLMGYLRIGSRELPINGSVMHSAVSGSQNQFSYTVGADTTNVYLNILRLFGHVTGLPSTLSYVIYMSAYGATSGGALVRPPYFNGVDINDSAAQPYIKAGYFDTQYRYPYRNNSSVVRIPRGRTISTGVGYHSATERTTMGWRYSVLGHVAQRNVSGIGGAMNGNNASFNATTIGVSL